MSLLAKKHLINDNKIKKSSSKIFSNTKFDIESSCSDSDSEELNIDSDTDDDSNNNNGNKIDKKCDNPSISTIYNMYFTRNRINLQPNYQREFSWSFDKMCTFIDSLMKGYVIPTFILYKLSFDEKTSDKNIDFECVDGQHRLKVLQKFMNSESISIGTYEKYIYWENIKKDKFGNKSKEKVFYNLTDEIKSKYKKFAREMTIDEKNFFDDIQLQFIIIQSKLNDRQKCDIFNRLQNGEKVSSITKVKNISHPITNYLRNNGIIGSLIIDEWGEIIKTNLSKRNSITSKNNYLIDHYTYFVIRLMLIYDKKSLDINYLNLNIRNYLENNYSMVKINGDIEQIYKNIITTKKNIIKKFDGYILIVELFMIIFYIKITQDEMFDKINKKSIKEIINNYNVLDKYCKFDNKNKVVSKDIMNKFSTEILEIIEKNK
jgi:hypothetical protein